MDRVTDLADPNRCKGTTGLGQCMNVALEGSDYCRVHARAYQAPEKGMRGYLLAKAADRARLAQLSEGEGIKSLRQEIDLVHMMIEEQWNAAGDTPAAAPVNESTCKHADSNQGEVDENRRST